MSLLDLVLLLALFIALMAGLSRGLLATLGGLIGLVLGGAAVFWAVPAVNDLMPTTQWRGPVSIAVAVLLPLFGASLGAGLGRNLRQGVDRTSLRPWSACSAAWRTWGSWPWRCRSWGTRSVPPVCRASRPRCHRRPCCARSTS
nr:hypothetical protein GCM10025730_08890 [Promicromonospora thailandica]